MKEKKIPTKNYLILFLLIVGTVAATVYLANIYINKQKYQSNQEITMDILLQLKEEDIATYVIENHDTIIYLSSNIQDTKINKKIKKLISKNEYNKDIVYINTDSMSDEFYTTFTNTYYSKELKKINQSLEKKPTLLIIRGGEVSSVLTIKDYDEKNILEFIEEKYNGVE